MEIEKQKYYRELSNRKLSYATINAIKDYMAGQNMKLEPVPEGLLEKKANDQRTTHQLTRLDLSIIRGNKSWEGLVVGFPGTKQDLATNSVGTPYLRMILYPILDLYHRIQEDSGKAFPCVYFIGERFSSTFLRKFYLLDQVIPHVIILTGDLFKCSKNKLSASITQKDSTYESWTQMKLCQKMASPEGLQIPIRKGAIHTRMLSHEVPCAEGTDNPERLDILGYDIKNKALIAFEIKGSNVGRVELDNLFLQAIEHRNWLEQNKMAVKFLFDKGPRGERVNTKKRVKLILGFYGSKVPDLFFELRQEATRSDKFLDIDFVHLINEDGEVQLSRFDNDL